MDGNANRDVFNEKPTKEDVITSVNVNNFLYLKIYKSIIF